MTVAIEHRADRLAAHHRYIAARGHDLLEVRALRRAAG
jgi:hypothetical protein